ncbi:MAG: 23S rRNA (adenine(2503)-C(2))-methyltransferase RlmN, partial [Candidatus Wildermuthbacteria bacterium]|nr:23S rRNA (adenine(2503)-C(2))-methyltransferase RlmN [Candidatus Wildermuthbacteria bacterium]
FQDLFASWDKASTLPQELRQKLQHCFPIEELKAEKVLVSEDNLTIKVLFELEDGLKIETVLMKHGSVDSPQVGRQTVCVSSQVGCSIGCEFCATGQQGFKRNLSSGEILEQVLFFARLLNKNRERVSSIVFMGMGEPFLNYDNVLEAINILNDKDGFNLGARHISISTSGIVEGIKKFTKEKLQVNLAISLHASNNALRSKLVPINEAYPLEKVLAAVEEYIQKTKRRVMFEYLMIDGVNDSLTQAKELAELLKGLLCFVNLISFNPVGHCEFKPSPGWKIKKFKEVLERGGISVTQRYRFGREIKAACGQLVGSDPTIAIKHRRLP